MEVTIDTHTLIWYLDQDQHSKLSQPAITAIRKSEIEGRIYIPLIVLAELMHISEKRRVTARFSEIHGYIRNSHNYIIVPFTEPILIAAFNLKELELHDRLILATAVHTQTPLISRDHELRKFNADVIW